MSIVMIAIKIQDVHIGFGININAIITNTTIAILSFNNIFGKIMFS